jgi:hypothetical protein
MRESLHVVWELMLIVGSVFIFRSIWLLLDVYLGDRALYSLLVLGFVLAVSALYMLNRHLEKYYKKKNS